MYASASKLSLVFCHCFSSLSLYSNEAVCTSQASERRSRGPAALKSRQKVVI